VRELVRRTSDLVRAVAAATRAMMLHVEGLMRQVDRHLSHAGTYGRRGTVEAGGPVLSALDLRT
jgi:hypothetical protein